MRLATPPLIASTAPTAMAVFAAMSLCCSSVLETPDGSIRLTGSLML